MEQDNPKWPPIAFFSLIGAIFIFFFCYMQANAYGPENPAYAMGNSHLAEAELIPEDFSSLVLALDAEVRVRDKRFVYRGMEDRSIRIEVIIPELDPDRGYLYQVPIDRAERGFNLSGTYFRLVKARQTRIEIHKVEPKDLC